MGRSIQLQEHKLSIFQQFLYKTSQLGTRIIMVEKMYIKLFSIYQADYKKHRDLEAAQAQPCKRTLSVFLVLEKLRLLLNMRGLYSCFKFYVKL